MKKRIVAMLLSFTLCMATVAETGATALDLFGDTATSTESGTDGTGTPEPEPTPEITPEVTPEITPEITPEATPEITPEITPEVTPEITPEITPVVTDPDQENENPDEINGIPNLDNALGAFGDTPDAAGPPQDTPEGTTQEPGQTTTVYQTVRELAPANADGSFTVAQDDWEAETVENETYWKLKKPVTETQQAVEIPVETEAGSEAGTAADDGSSAEAQPEYFTKKDGIVKITTTDGGTGEYLFDENGRMLTGWQMYEGSNYFFEELATASPYARSMDAEVNPANSNLGQMKKAGFQEIDGETYYFDESGRAVTGEYSVEGELYYFDPDSEKPGAMYTGWLSEENDARWRYFGPTWTAGAQVAKLDTDKMGDYEYLLDENGYIRKSEMLAVGEYTYGADSNGRIYKSIPVQYEGIWYYFQADGTRLEDKPLYYKNKWYYFQADGTRLENKPVYYKNKWYYFQANGTRLENKPVYYKNKWYYFQANGTRLENKPVYYKNKWYYFQANGTRLENKPVKYKNKWYYFQANGARLENKPVYYKNKWYYFQANGTRLEDKPVKYKDKWYYFQANGTRLESKPVKYKGYWYYFQANGARLENLPVKYKGYWYYFQGNGRRLENKPVKYKGYWYYFQGNGKRLENEPVQYKGYWYYFQGNGKRAEDKLITYGKYRYYFRSNGRRATWKNQWVRCEGAANRVYYFGSVAGRVAEKTGWQKVTVSGDFYGWFYYSSNGEHYVDKLLSNGLYFRTDGRLAWGPTQVNKTMYFFEVSSATERRGKMFKNTLISYKNKIYYAQSSGELFNDGWKKISGNWYYFQDDYTAKTSAFATHDGVSGYLDKDGKFTTGWVVVNDSKNQVRYLDPDNQGAFLKNCSEWIDGKLYYFDSNGYRKTDVSDLYKWPYYLEVDRVNGVCTVYNDSSKKIPVKTIRVSVGKASTPTPLGEYTLMQAGRWQMLMGPSWGQYASHVVGAGNGGIFVHSVACGSQNLYNLPAVDYNMLGSPASHGCIRMCVGDAYWVWDNCSTSRINIIDGTYTSKETEKGPLGRNPLTPLVYPYNYDPTDPLI